MSAAAPPTDDSSSRISVPPPGATEPAKASDKAAVSTGPSVTTAPSSSTVPTAPTVPLPKLPTTARPTPSRAQAAGLTSVPSPTATPPTGVRTIACPCCGGEVDVKSPHVAVFKGAVRVYCSAACLEAREPIPTETSPIVLPKSRRVWWIVAGAALAAGGVTAFLVHRQFRGTTELAAPDPSVASTQSAADPEPSAVNDPQKEADVALVKELMHDAWIHPLAGPERRMPRNHNGAFGASRGGDRPPECVSGHCGVDVGNVWGERIYAVHDGVVDFVNRGPNEDSGGVFVRIAHRGGTLFSWYFHLAAVPKNIRAGEKVSAGTLVGLLGDTGVKNSGPHLHFALSVRTSKHVRERYLDPEPLIAIWPLWIPHENGGGMLSTAEPGFPQRGGSGPRRKRRDKASDKLETELAPPATVPAAAPAPSEAPPAPAIEAPTGTSN
ncbi:MAG TPA: peptidoglycan DD-metalloendopeptidase family protein [Kofleriaceae bacterium]